MSAEVVDFVARLSAIKRKLYAAQHQDTMANDAASTYDIEGDHPYSDPSGKVDLMELRLTLLELRAELPKKQVELFQKA